MKHFKNIQLKLEAFIRRYYLNQLLKGTMLFLAIGLLYFLLTLLIEHVLWLNVKARTALFWVFILVEMALLLKFIVIPLAQLLKLKKGIDFIEASKIIGRHFPNVNDKLLNVLQLKSSSEQSELLLASIEQKSAELSPIPFKLAINLKASLRYFKYAAIPVMIILAMFITGNSNWFSSSYNRVVHYKTAYEQPAPFQFYVLNESMHVVEGKDFKLKVKVAGELLPEQVEIEYNNQNYFLKNNGTGDFEYTFSQLNEPVQFHLQSNKVRSKLYDIVVIEAPALVNFEMHLDYPDYTNKPNEILKGTGNAVVPEGTKVTWNFTTKATNEVRFYSRDTIKFKRENSDKFSYSRSVFNNMSYSISTSNEQLVDYEKLGFTIGVVKDEYPRIAVQMKKDSIDLQSMYFQGQVNDDYGFTNLQLVYHPVDNEEELNASSLEVSTSNVMSFVNTFPGDLNVRPGVSYAVQFRVFDNDVINRYKSATSDVFIYRKRTVEEEKERRLNSQKESIKGLDNTLKKFDEQDKELQKLSNVQKEKTGLNFNDKMKLESFIERQKKQDEMMKNFNKQLQQNISERPERELKSQFSEALKERLKENEMLLEKDEKLLEELKELQDKINKDELNLKLDELAKRNKNKKRSLVQLLELTKRFYVEQKLDKLKEDLMKQSIEQERLSNESEENNTKEHQEKLNKQFYGFKKELEELKKESDALSKPINIPQDKLTEKEIQEAQKAATEALTNKQGEISTKTDKPDGEQKKEELNEAKQNQKKASKKLMKLSQQMQGAMQAGGSEQMQEDVDMLRQILDNLVLFSLDEEDLMKQFQNIEENHSKYANYLKKQNYLKEHFEHIDDSLFALSLRQPKLSEKVNKEIGEVYYNIEKALELLVENQLYQGISKQQFAITATNNLADFLSEVLDNMEEKLNMSMSSKGDGDMSLPDIIMSQEELNKMMEKGMSQGESDEEKQEGESKEGKDGESIEKEGENGSSTEGEKGGDSDGSDGLGGDENMELLFEIYKRQQELRNELEDRLQKEGINADAKRLLRTMESVEMDLLNNGFNDNTLRRMRSLKHQLLKLEKASFEQEEESKRTSKANKREFVNTADSLIIKAKQYFNTVEILNKQSLPLQPVYKRKVNEYFKSNND